MKNFDWQESNMCKFNECAYYDFENNKCSLTVCKMLSKK